MTFLSAKAKAHGMAVALVSGAAVLFRFPPEQYHFYPQCPVFRYLHMYCPGCGATRALAALLHGRVMDALHYNALAVFLLPPVLYLLIRAYVRVCRGERLDWPEIPAPVINGILLASMVFAVVRNTLLAAR